MRLTRSGVEKLLLRALASSSEAEAEQIWRSFRDSTELDRLPWQLTQLLPMLNGRWEAWLRDDPCEGIFRGIVRRTWSEAQIRLRMADAMAAQLEDKCGGPVVLIGPAAMFVFNRYSSSVRPISDLRFLISRECVDRAAKELLSDGWNLHGAIPASGEMGYRREIAFSRRGFKAFIFWRVVKTSPAKARRCEREFLENRRALGTRQVLGAEHALLAVLCGRLDRDPDVIPWQADAASLTLPADWRRFESLAQAYAPKAFGRVNEMRKLGLDVPAFPNVAVRMARLFLPRFQCD